VPIEMDGQPAYIAFTPDHHWPFVELCRLAVPDSEPPAQLSAGHTDRSA
jgi:hypothetical protein